MKVWNSRRSGYREDADQVVEIPGEPTHHGGADPHLVAEFVRFVRDGGATLTSPVAARAAVAAGYAATTSLRVERHPDRHPGARPGPGQLLRQRPGRGESASIPIVTWYAAMRMLSPRCGGL